jgi:uracil-DNA glycosylase
VNDEKQAALSTLFSRHFNFERMDRYQSGLQFNCINMSDSRCNVTSSEPKYTPFLGSPNTTVLAIGDAPSTANGGGGFFGGLFEDIENNRRSPVAWVRDFVREEYGCIPHFTDFAKCGVENQREDGHKLKPRYKHCASSILRAEIDILQPELILLIGGASRRNYEREITNSTYKTRYLLHYSGQNTPYHHGCYECIKRIWKEQIRDSNTDLRRFKGTKCPHK